MLLICDEVATGFGRTGTLFASEQCGLRPDLLVLGKGLTAGYLPMSATVASGRGVRRVPRPRPLASARCTTGTRTRGTRWRPRSRCATSSCSTRGRCSTTCAPAPTSCAALLDDRVAPHPAVREVRLRGLMGGVELAPPTRRAALGPPGVRGRGRARRAAPPARRRRRAHAAAHGHVGGAAPHRARAHRRPRRGRRRDIEPTSTWDEWAARRDRARSRDAGQWRAPRCRSIPTAPRRAWCRSRRTTTSASPSTPRSSPPPTTPSTAGAPAPGAARLIVGSRPVHHELEAELAGWKRHRGGGALPHRLRRQPRRAHARSPVPTRSSAPTSSTTRRSSTAAVSPARRSRSTATATPPTSTRSCRATTDARAIVVTDTVFSMDGDVAPVDELLDVCAHHGALLVLDEAHAVLGPPLDAIRDDVDVLRVGTLSKTLGALGGFVAGPRRLTDLLVNRARVLHLHHRVDARPTPRPRSPRCASCAPPRATRCAPGCAPTSTGCAPGTRRRSSRRVRRRGSARSGRRRALLDARPARPRHPPADRAAGHVTAAGRAVGRPHRRAGRPRSPPRSPTSSRPRERGMNAARPRTLVFVSRHRHRRRQDLVDGRGRARAARRGRARRRAQAGAVVRPRRADRRRRPRRRHRRGARHRVPAAPHLSRWRGRRRWPPASSARPPFTIADLAGGIDVAGGGRRRSGRGRRRTALADRRRRRHRRPRALRSRPTSSCSSPTPGSAPSTRCGSRSAVSPASRWSSRSTGSRRPTPSTRATASTSRPSTASTSSPNPARLADRLRLPS